MIKSLMLEGFKSFVRDEIDFNILTILSGLNSSGKSSIIQALLLLEKAAQKKDIYLEGHGNLAECQNPYSKDGIAISAKFENGNKIGILNESVIENSGWFPEIIHITADRFGPETSVGIYNISSKLGKRGENIFKCIEDNADKIIPELLRHEKSEGETFFFNLKAWLNIVSPNTDFKSFVERKSDSSYSTFNGHRAKNVGFGLSYALPIITALLLGSIDPQNSIVILENPEAHLHPRGQTEMARLICLCASVGVQVIVETHSDHLFDGVRLFTKANQGFEKKVITYWFELDENRNTDVSSVTFDENGRIAEWPKGMFDQFSVNASQLL